MRQFVNCLIITLFVVMEMAHFKLHQFSNAMEVLPKLFTYIETNCNNNTNINSINYTLYKLNEVYIKPNKHQQQLNKNSFTLNQHNKSRDNSNIMQKYMRRLYKDVNLNVNNTVNNNSNNNNNVHNNKNKSEANDYYNINNKRHAMDKQIFRHNTSYDKFSDDVLANHKYNINNNNNSNKNSNDINYSRDFTSLTKLKYSPIKMQHPHKTVFIGINDTHGYYYAHVDNHYHDNDYNKHKRQRRALNDLLIAPNTRWCGRGNIANNTYNHLGGALAADKCCRKHDHCPVFIPSLNKRFEIFNYRPYTLSHCSCDRRFRTCLKMANDDYAKAIGKIFFNVIQTQCIVLRKEHTCQQRARNGDCLMEHTKQRAYLKKNKKF